MICRLLSALALLAAAGAARAQIAWTPLPKDPRSESPAIVTAAEINGRRVQYGPPLGWSVSGGHVIPPKVSQADGYAFALAIAAPVAWTDDRVKAMQAGVLRQLAPKGATEVAIKSSGLLDLKVAGAAVYEITIAYKFFGQAYAASAAFIEKGQTQLQFCFGSLGKDFSELHGSFVRSLLSLDGL